MLSIQGKGKGKTKQWQGLFKFDEVKMSRKKKILIADDEILVHEMLTIALSSNEFEIIHAYDGQETVNCIDNEQPDLVVLDIMMPIKDGRDICRDLKLNPKTKDIKILMLSAKDEQFDRITGLERSEERR